MIPYTQTYIGMEVDSLDDVERNPYYSVRWRHIAGGRFRLVEMYKKPEHLINHKPTPDPKGIITERDRWHLDPKTDLYVEEEEETKSLAMMPMMLVGVAIIALWYFLFGGMRK